MVRLGAAFPVHGLEREREGRPRATGLAADERQPLPGREGDPTALAAHRALERELARELEALSAPLERELEVETGHAHVMARRGTDADAAAGSGREEDDSLGASALRSMLALEHRARAGGFRQLEHELEVLAETHARVGRESLSRRRNRLAADGHALAGAGLDAPAGSGLQRIGAHELRVQRADVRQETEVGGAGA